MKGLIELSNFAVCTVSSKCTTLSETEGEVEDTPKIYGKCMGICFKLNFKGDAKIRFKLNVQRSCRA